MKKILIAVFSVILCLSALTSCKNEAGETIVIESEAVETTAGETTEELTTPEITTEEITETTTEETTETTTDETEEAASEVTTISIPDEETILASLSDEEKEVWLSMPDIVTMRMLERFDDDNNEILYTEIVYIDKIGQIKKFITYDDPASPYDDITIAWLNEQISQNEDAEIIDIADIHTLIEFYNTFMCIDSNSKLYLSYSITPDEYIERHYYFQIYGIRADGKNDIETLRFSSNDAGNPHIRRNYTAKDEPFDTSGIETLNMYLQLEPFMVLIDGGYGHLAGEEV